MSENTENKKEISDFSKDELLTALREKGFFGLVYKDYPENPFEFPVLSEERKFRIGAGSGNFIIEGDNLNSLKALEKSYSGRIDVIYIDPPYNRGKNDLNYDDDFTDKTDKWKNSKWLSFMKNRLVIAKRLLTEDGVIFLSIDDNSQAELKILCETIFGRHNFLCDFIRKTKSTTNNSNTGINVQHENTLCFAKNKEKVRFYGETKLFENYKNPDDDPNGAWVIADPSAISGGQFPIKNPYTGKIDLPPRGRGWMFSESRIDELVASGKIKFKQKEDKGERGFIFKRYKNEVKNEDAIVSTLDFAQNDYMNQAGTKELQNIFDGKPFSFPKPSVFVKKLIQAVTKNKKDAIILDFFAGSGTTGQSVLELNAQDGGNRTFILCSSNEINDKCAKENIAKGMTEGTDEWFDQGICRKITYERIKRVMTGFQGMPKGFQPTGGTCSYMKVSDGTDLTSFISARNFANQTFDEIIRTPSFSIYVNEKICSAYFFGTYKNWNRFTKEVEKASETSEKILSYSPGGTLDFGEPVPDKVMAEEITF